MTLDWVFHARPNKRVYWNEDEWTYGGAGKNNIILPVFMSFGNDIILYVFVYVNVSRYKPESGFTIGLCNH